MSAPTPGPWVVNRGEDSSITNLLYKGLIAFIKDDGDEPPLFVCNPDDYAVEEEELLPNAHLIASAPEMLAALREIEAHHVKRNRQKGRAEERSLTLRIARAAIAKAEGK
jgi:hypothetical protein